MYPNNSANSTAGAVPVPNKAASDPEPKKDQSDEIAQNIVDTLFREGFSVSHIGKIVENVRVKYADNLRGQIADASDQIEGLQFNIREREELIKRTFDTL